MMPGQGPGSALPRLVFGVQKAVESLAQAIPQAAKEVDLIRTLLGVVLQKAVAGGGGPSPLDGMDRADSPMNGEERIPPPAGGSY